MASSPWVRVGVGFALVYGSALLLLRKWNREGASLGAVTAKPDDDFVDEMRADPERAEYYRRTANKAREAAQRIVAEGRGFGRKAFLADVAREMGMPMSRFAPLALSWNRLGWISLSRADLVAAMDTKKVDDSTIHWDRSEVQFMDTRDHEEDRRREREAAAKRATRKRSLEGIVTATVPPNVAKAVDVSAKEYEKAARDYNRTSRAAVRIVGTSLGKARAAHKQAAAKLDSARERLIRSINDVSEEAHGDIYRTPWSDVMEIVENADGAMDERDFLTGDYNESVREVKRREKAIATAIEDFKAELKVAPFTWEFDDGED